ncbi:Nif3-like dinuclear metal center hexameric protein [Georgenia sp. EYE_87]|uniref:Nif3-like dinuclear metal center hexameric protein n=1 Tax=Georgenia sp. EYE_87 TaxID=2853448 RepID=UPI002004D836|nr:Nif3-like dinuclear metal center hexameric protein [Georgenia sp. EYE_87]MCK6209380.1 Nif3-like dinuclear metal center hexameric protein [Georgenia sp. EYE_87]
MPELTLADVVDLLERHYPPSTAEDWDAVGLVVGDPTAPVRTVLLAVDPTEEVVAEALALGADLLVTHHPLYLRGTSSVAATTPKGRSVHALARGGCALYAAHTNADAAADGVAQALADLLGLEGTTPIDPLPGDRLDTLVTFVPREATAAVLDALADAGAGRLGDYERAAFTSPGTGTFRPLPGANPTVGAVGAVEEVAEDRLEIVLPRHRREAVLAALRRAHPYEEPAFTLVAQAAAGASTGTGRIGRLATPTTLRAFAERVAQVLPATAQGIRVGGDLDAEVSTVAVCGGAGDSLLGRVRSLGADVYLTADLRHHPASEHLAGGRPYLVDATHWASEWPWLPRAAEVLRSGATARGTRLDVHVSTLVTDPWDLHLAQQHSSEPGSSTEGARP